MRNSNANTRSCIMYTRVLSLSLFLIFIACSGFSQIRQIKPAKPPYDPEDTVTIQPGFEYKFKPGTVQLDMIVNTKVACLSPSFDMNVFRVGLNKKEEFYVGSRIGVDIFTIKKGNNYETGSPYQDFNLMAFGKMEKKSFRMDVYSGATFHLNSGPGSVSFLKKFLFKAGADFRVKLYRNIAGLVVKGWYTRANVIFGIGIFAGYGFIERKY
jgi:hypothetical protein